MTDKMFSRLGWWLVRKFDKERYDLLIILHRKHIEEAVGVGSPFETPLYSNIKTEINSEWETS